MKKTANESVKKNVFIKIWDCIRFRDKNGAASGNGGWDWRSEAKQEFTVYNSSDNTGSGFKENLASGLKVRQ